MLHIVQSQRSRATAALLEPGFRIRNEALSLALLALASFLLVSSPLSCDMRAAHAQAGHVDNTTLNKLARYHSMLKLIDSFYLEDRDVAGVLDSAIANVLATLDPHTYYLDPEETRDANSYYFGEKGGSFGITLSRKNKYLLVHKVHFGGPAERGGILPGDHVERIWDQPVADLSEAEVDGFFKTQSFIELSVSRKDGKKRFKVRITKNHIPTRTVEFYEMLDDVTAYIYLTGFALASATELRNALKELEYQGMKKLVLDIRNNDGGLLNSAHECAALFLEKGAKLTAVKRRIDTGLVYDTVRETGRYSQLEMVLLIDDESASAAEVLAGILQDHDRAILIGTATYGKALVQNQFQLPDGGALRLTTGRYHLPSGRYVQRDYKGGQYVAAWPDLKPGLNLDHSRDTLFHAVGHYRTAKGRTVYGAQGIIPDVIATLDTLPQIVKDLNSVDVFDLFLDNYLNFHGETIRTRFPMLDTLLQGYRFPKEIFSSLVRTAVQAGVTDAAERMQPHKAFIMAYVKRWICHRFHAAEGWVKSRRPNDRQLQAALTVLQERLVLK